MKLLADPDVYSDAVLDRFEDPPGAGWFDAPDRVGCASSKIRNSQVCFAVRLDGDAVAEARFRARGCPHTIAAASAASEALRGLALEALASFDAESIVTGLPIPANKLDIRILIEDAVRAASQQDG
ncbi:MAG: iron-sulfur cluster assembly scaffold protein [Gammaproteobacteria bacterium]|nr:iron-sulfur cluster assembly scaffold protein [Gammaproteobacteria bacterium]